MCCVYVGQKRAARKGDAGGTEGQEEDKRKTQACSGEGKRTDGWGLETFFASTFFFFFCPTSAHFEENDPALLLPAGTLLTSKYTLTRKTLKHTFSRQAPPKTHTHTGAEQPNQNMWPISLYVLMSSPL